MDGGLRGDRCSTCPTQPLAATDGDVISQTQFEKYGNEIRDNQGGDGVSKGSAYMRKLQTFLIRARNKKRVFRRIYGSQDAEV